MKNKFTTLIILTLIVSCTSQKEDTELGWKFYFKDYNVPFSGHIDSLIMLANSTIDGLGDTTLILTYADGAKYLEITSKSGLLDSSLLEYYENGSIKSEINFEKGKLAFGEQGEYYDKFLSYAFRTDDDTMIMETPIYKYYYHTDPSNSLCYRRDYNEKGDPISSGGNLIAYAKPSRKLDIEIDTIGFHFYLVREPYSGRYYDLERKFYVTLISNVDTLSEELEINEEFSAVFYERSADIKKIRSILGVAEFQDIIYTPDSTIFSTILYDTVEIKIEALNTGYNNS